METPGNSAATAAKPVMLRIMGKFLEQPAEMAASTGFRHVFWRISAVGTLPASSVSFTLAAGLPRMYALSDARASRWEAAGMRIADGSPIGDTSSPQKSTQRDGEPPHGGHQP